MFKYPIYKPGMLLVLAAIVVAQFACKKDSVNSNPPQISQIRAITPAPNDSVLTTALPGQYVVIQGANLAAASNISFYGFEAFFNPGLFSEGNLVVKVPNILWDSIPTGKLKTVEVTTPAGTASYTFNITAPAPSVSAISNENAKAGAVITISGSNFYGVKSVIFPGGKTATPTTSTTKSIVVTVPDGVSAGAIQIVGDFGTGSSTIIFDNYLAPTTGFLANFEDGDAFFGWQWWGGNKTNDAATFPNNTGNFIQVHPPSSIGAGNGGWYSDNRAVMVASSPWLPESNLGDPISNYALKFEINVKDPWKAGSFMIAPNGNFNMMARYAPWETAPGGEFTTNGQWQTVVIPLTKFLSGSGSYNPSGSPASNIGGLTGGSNAAPVQIMLYNDGTTTLDSFNAAVDNVRIVKIN